VVQHDFSRLARSLLKPVQGRTSQTGLPGSSWESTLVNRVLVVDDEQTLAQNLQAYLQAQGLEVHVAHDGASGIEQAASLAPQVIVLDYRLPDMEGFQVLETVRRNRQCHFVLITAHPTVEVRERAAELGVSHVLFKPFPLVELARAIFDLMGIERRRRATDNPAEGFVERRQNKNESFPLQLYDGSWVLADRRRNGAKPPGPDDDQLLTGE
jgi:DNA-binding response OmpR family regulator